MLEMYGRFGLNLNLLIWLTLGASGRILWLVEGGCPHPGPGPKSGAFTRVELGLAGVGASPCGLYLKASSLALVVELRVKLELLVVLVEPGGGGWRDPGGAC